MSPSSNAAAAEYLHIASHRIAVALLEHDQGSYDDACESFAMAADYARASLSYIDAATADHDFYAEATFVYLMCLARSRQYERFDRECDIVLGAPYSGRELLSLKYAATKLSDIVKARN